MKNIVLTLITVFSFSFAAFAEEAQQPPASTPNEPAASGPKRERQQMKRELHEKIREKAAAMHEKMKAACSSDMSAAGCTDKEGPEMMRCMRAYKEAHPDFKASDSCKQTMGEHREFGKEKHEIKKEMRDKMHEMRHGNPPPVSGTSTPGH